MKRLVWFGFALSVLLLAGCDSPRRTADSLRREITEYKAKPDEKTQIQIDQDFAKLERQIAELERKGEVEKADDFRDELFSLRGDYQAAKMAKTIQDAKNALQGFGEAFKQTAKSIEESLKGSPTNTNSR